MDKKMALPKGLLKRSNGYYFQGRIPKQYLSHYSSPRIYFKLPVETLKEAVLLVHEKWAELHQDFKRIDSTGSRPKIIPTSAKADHLISLALHSRMSADEEIRSAGVDDFMYDRLSEYQAEAEDTERKAVARGQLTPHAIAVVTDWLLGNGFEPDTESKEFKDFAIRFIKAQTQATKGMKLRHAGEAVETAPCSTQVRTQRSSHTRN
jgi:hypothetical protein